MSPESPMTCLASLNSSIALIDQFSASLSVPSTNANDSIPTSNENLPSPVALLQASGASLKSSVTKLSLLTITTPFTPTAVVTQLKSLNESILPSLVSATLLTVSTAYPECFCTECKALSRMTLQDLRGMLLLVQKRATDSRPKKDIAETEKQAITEVTGRVWEDCDAIEEFATGGVPSLVAKKAKQWLELMKDAVQELQEWDPEEEVDENDIFGDIDSADENEETLGSGEKSGGDTDRATISAGVKEQALKVLSRIPQSIHVVVKQRLEKLKSSFTNAATELNSTSSNSSLDRIVKGTRTISDCIDESVESMYMGNLEQCLKKAGEAKAITIEVVEAALRLPGTEVRDGADSKEDKYLQRALQWIQQVDTGANPRAAKSSEAVTTNNIEKANGKA